MQREDGHDQECRPPHPHGMAQAASPPGTLFAHLASAENKEAVPGLRECEMIVALSRNNCVSDESPNPCLSAATTEKEKLQLGCLPGFWASLFPVTAIMETGRKLALWPATRGLGAYFQTGGVQWLYVGDGHCLPALSPTLGLQVLPQEAQPHSVQVAHAHSPIPFMAL